MGRFSELLNEIGGASGLSDSLVVEGHNPDSAGDMPKRYVRIRHMCHLIRTIMILETPIDATLAEH